MTVRLAIFKPDEALKKVCPVSMSTNAQRCRAAECLAWRWYATHVPSEADHGELIKRGDAYGYCGMAGHPQTAAP